MVRLPPRLRPLFPYLKPTYVAATRAVAPTMQRVSRRRNGYLPTGVVATLEEAAAKTGGKCVQARPLEVIERGTMTGRPPNMPLADEEDGNTVVPVLVAELPNGRVLGPNRAFIDGDGELIHDVSLYFGTKRPRENPVFLNPFPQPPARINGRLGVLAHRGDKNYFHFLMDVLTKVGVLELTPDIAPPDAWYVPAGTSWQREFLDLMGIGADQRIDATKQPHVQADCLVVPMPPSMVENMPPWAVEFLRSRLLPKVDTSGPRRNVYVTRGPSANNRSIVNEPELIKLLAEYDFEHVDPGQLSVADQIRTFATANIIVAPHGAAQANIIFAPHGSSLVELFPAGCVLPYFWRLACSVPGMRYRYVSAHGGPRRPTAARTLTRDIDVDIAAVEATLKELS